MGKVEGVSGYREDIGEHSLSPSCSPPCSHRQELKLVSQALVTYVHGFFVNY